MESYTYARGQVAWHTVEITGLAPGTTYHYRCGGPGGWSGDYSFTTAPEYGPRNLLRIAVFGDSRGGWDTLQQVFQAVKKERADLIVFTGDFTNGASQYEYDKFFAAGAGVLEGIPFMPVHGNHEMGLQTYGRTSTSTATTTTTSGPGRCRAGRSTGTDFWSPIWKQGATPHSCSSSPARRSSSPAGGSSTGSTHKRERGSPEPVELTFRRGECKMIFVERFSPTIELS